MEAGTSEFYDDLWRARIREREQAERPSIVAGDRMERNLGDFLCACEVSIIEEQEKLAPDNALIALLCDAVRLARETIRLATRPI